jgi:ribosomal protein S14
MLVESSTFYGAVAKGAAAATLLASSATELTVDDCTIIYDLEDEPAAQLTDRWPVLPAAVRISSTDGEQLFAAAHDRTAWTDQSAVDSDCEPTTYLYDEGGSGIRDEQRLATVLDNVGDDAWLVPAIALQQAPKEREPEHQDSGIPTKERLECHQCGRTTDHRFSGHESVPDETWTGHAIWECQVCGTPRYGPSPE